MNKAFFPRMLYAGLFFMLAACQASQYSPNVSVPMARPGDRIAGMNVVTGVQDAAPLWAFCERVQQSDTTVRADCDVQVSSSSSLAIGQIFTVADDQFRDVDISEPIWELTIDGQLVDLNAFGTVTYLMPDMPSHPSRVKEVFRQVTVWDVVLTNLTPGKHLVQGMALDDEDSYTWIIHITVHDHPHLIDSPSTGRQEIPGQEFLNPCGCRPIFLAM